MGPDAQHAAHRDLCPAAGGGAAGRDDLHHLNRVQSAFRRIAVGHGGEVKDARGERAPAAQPSPSPQSKSAVADVDHSIDGPKPAYTRFRLGEGWGGGSRRSGTLEPNGTAPIPDPSPQGGGGKWRDRGGPAQPLLSVRGLVKHFGGARIWDGR